MANFIKLNQYKEYQYKLQQSRQNKTIHNTHTPKQQQTKQNYTKNQNTNAAPSKKQKETKHQPAKPQHNSTTTAKTHPTSEKTHGHEAHTTEQNRLQAPNTHRKQQSAVKAVPRIPYPFVKQARQNLQFMSTPFPREDLNIFHTNNS
jgi:hypothetical protein